MNQVIQREASTVGLQVRQRRNRELLAELLEGYDLVDIGESVPVGVDLCVVDEAGYSRCRETLSAWKAEQSPTYAPVLLLAEADAGNPWARHAGRSGDSIDAILQIPLPRRAILARIQSLLETRRYANELTSERELNRRIFDTSPVAKTVLDTDGIIVRANQRAEEILGLEASAIEGMAYNDPDWKMTNADGEPLPPGETPFEVALQTGEPVYGQEIVIDRPDGSRTWLSVSVSPLHDVDGQIEYLVASMDDVTEERRLERELRASEELHRATLENITDTVLITDDEGAFTYVCPNTQHLFGLTTDEVEALGDIEALLDTDPAPADLEAVGLVESVQLTVTDAAGAEHVVLATVKAVSIQDGERLYSLRDVTERAAMERELNETVQSRSIALEAADAGVWEWDIHADELTGDESLESITGTSAADVGKLQELFGEIVHPDDVASLEAAIERSIDRLDPFEVTVRVRTADGETRWLEARGRPLTDDTGAPTRLLGVAIDVTERVARERELERYERIVETAPEPIYALDAGGQITLANQAFVDLFGLERTAVVGSNITEHLQAENVEASIEHIMALAEGESPGPIEMEIETVEGARSYELNIALHGGDDDEALPGTVGVAHDVTELRERERLLRRAQRAVEASGHAIYITDPEGIIVYVNPAFERVTGYPSEDAIGEPPTFLRASLADDDHHEALWQTITAGEIWDEEIVNRRRDGEPYHADQTIAPITDEAGEIEGYVAIQTDITEHKDRLQQLQVMDRVLRHNLHNAMNVILGYASLIEESATGGSIADAKTIGRKGQELLDLVDKQRSITQSLSTDPEMVAVDLAVAIERIEADVAERHPDATLEVEIDTDEPVARAATGIEKAVRELVLNAIEHADRPEPAVSVEVTRTPTTVTVRIADDGPGIPEMDKRVVTGEPRIEPLYHGSGLGLWLVSWLVRRSGGSLTFEENDPRGTIVTIGLQADDRPSNAPE